MIHFTCSREDHNLIAHIVSRIKQHDRDYERIDAEMDITAYHASIRKLRLAELVRADNFGFWHDVYGIRRHLARRRAGIEDYFVPRFAADQVSA